MFFSQFQKLKLTKHMNNLNLIKSKCDINNFDEKTKLKLERD